MCRQKENTYDALRKSVYQMWRAMEVAVAYALEDAQLRISISPFSVLFMLPLTKTHPPSLARLTSYYIHKSSHTFNSFYNTQSNIHSRTLSKLHPFSNNSPRCLCGSGGGGDAYGAFLSVFPFGSIMVEKEYYVIS